MPAPRRRLLAAAKLLFALLIVVFVARHFVNTMAQEGLNRPPPIRWELLVPCGLLYLAAHTIWATFWWQLLRQAGVRASWATGARVYFVSQFGKYIPGKAWVIGMRVALLHQVPGAHWSVVTGLGFIETLTNMAAGALLAVMLVPWAGGAVGQLEGKLPSEWAAVGVLLLPFIPWTISRLARRRRGPDARPLPVPPVGLLFLGLLQSTAGWCLLALSLRCGTAAVVPDLPALSPAGFVADLAVASAAYIAGFLMLVSPGGLGVRELVLQEMLTPRLVGLCDSPAAAGVVVALLVRLVWTAFEAALAGVWYLAGKRTPTDAA